MTDQELRFFNEQGLIPGPDESEEAFAKRAAFCLKLHQNLESHLGQDIPFQPEERTDLSFFAAAKEKTERLFGISPDWIPIFFSNYQLYPWHGGCAWIFQLTENSPTAALLQMRKKIPFYNRDELIAHELSHVGRMMFEEPLFEEVLAYETSGSFFRRYFGPIVQSSIESFIFILTLLGIVVLDAYLILFHPFAYWHAMWLKGMPLLMIAYGVFRLWKKQRIKRRCFANLLALVKEEGKARALLYRLTDKEIIQFASWSADQIARYIENENSLRWRAAKLSGFTRD